MKKLSHTELYDAIKELDQKQFSDWQYLSKFIIERAGLSLNKCLFEGNKHLLTSAWGGVKARQYPDELGKFLAYIYKNKHKINSYMEVGIDFGGTLFIIDSFLRVINENYEGSLGIDISKKRKFIPYYEAYTNRFPTCKIKLPRYEDIYEMPIDKVYDLCFIDALHSYEHVKKDHERYAPYAKILAFHDIKLRKTQQCVADYWPEIKTEDSIECLNEDDRFIMEVGIGILNP